MVTIKDIEQVLTMVRNKGLRVIIKFKKSRNMMALEKEIRALSPEGNYVAWASAFPAPPHQIIDAYGVASIEIYCGGELVRQVSDWRELVKELQLLNECR
ncbi:hypothetical protein [Vulcanisaeta souniana]|uniref:Uncharacterized protein n=1 Tax=Vulcanisaeta souniana JCM 11219 TaxID=1293586 RepID=A0A830E5R2_9CREN|nr:hypothetical protein [Vulcanisaeta souniana]BDR91547.1 hypothetical protein Vsou_06400 [Vulcanisaeta souniana JCM 11219]GGI74053.1 hypothetical protein GCM10007112_08580 [Vulcanisaeta souniana JCM 11219]